MRVLIVTHGKPSKRTLKASDALQACGHEVLWHDTSMNAPDGYKETLFWFDESVPLFKGNFLTDPGVNMTIHVDKEGEQ